MNAARATAGRLPVRRPGEEWRSGARAVGYRETNPTTDRIAARRQTGSERLVDNDRGRLRMRVGGCEPTPRENTHAEYVEQVCRDEIHA